MGRPRTFLARMLAGAVVVPLAVALGVQSPAVASGTSVVDAFDRADSASLGSTSTGITWQAHAGVVLRVLAGGRRRVGLRAHEPRHGPDGRHRVRHRRPARAGDVARPAARGRRQLLALRSLVLRQLPAAARPEQQPRKPLAHDGVDGVGGRGRPAHLPHRRRDLVLGQRPGGRPDGGRRQRLVDTPRPGRLAEPGRALRRLPRRPGAGRGRPRRDRDSPCLGDRRSDRSRPPPP